MTDTGHDPSKTQLPALVYTKEIIDQCKNKFFNRYLISILDISEIV
jgi:hypothetical protein